jgi:DNA-binding transcriptional regulator YdaS (Cro superfamily)
MTGNPSIWREAQAAAGGPDALAERLGIARRTLFKWKREGVPAEAVALVSAATGIPAARLRPDLAAAFTPASAP